MLDEQIPDGMMDVMRALASLRTGDPGGPQAQALAQRLAEYFPGNPSFAVVLLVRALLKKTGRK